MRADADFSGYVEARWPAVVRSLVLLGCPEELAPDVALSALARVRKDWSRALEGHDLDAVVERALVQAWAEQRETTWWTQLGSAPPSLEPELVAALDRLPGETRERAVFTALGRGVATSVPGLPAERIRDAAEAVPVLAAPDPDRVVSRGREQRRRRTGRQLAIVVPLVLAVAAVTWWVSRPPPPSGLGALEVRREDNPAPVAWYVNGQLHLDHVVLALPDAGQIEQVSGGAAYTDARGRVVFVRSDGTRTVLGRHDPDTLLVASDEDGWVAWIEPPGDDPLGPHLVVRDLAAGEDLIDRPLPPGKGPLSPQLIATAEDDLYYVDGQGTHALTVESGLVLTGHVDGLLDAKARTRAFQQDGHTVRVTPSSSVEHRLDGFGAQVSTDGGFLLTRPPDDPFGRVLVYDVRTGAEVDSGTGPEDVVVVAELGDDATVTYVVARAADLPEDGAFLRSSFSGQLELRTCHLDTGECEALERFSSTGSGPLLAR